MTDDLDYVPELRRPPGHASLREQLNEVSKALAEERQARAQAEADAVRMAEYIASRVGAKVWAHDDALRVVAATVRALLENPLAVMAEAKGRGIPPTYTAIAALMTRRALELRTELQQAFDAGELDRAGMLSAEMRQSLIAQFPSPEGIAPSLIVDLPDDI